jgi:hypothetical protein
MGRRRLYARRRRRTYRSVALSPDVFEGAPSAFDLRQKLCSELAMTGVETLRNFATD